MNKFSAIEYEQSLVEDVSSRLDLRDPNKFALDAVAREFDKFPDTSFEAICEIATAVGKTYLAAGIIEYLAASKVRNILIVVPGRTVLSKTIENFTPGSSKSINGLEAEVYLVTAENFNTSATRNAFDDPTKLKLFVFTVQSLIKPPADLERKTREFQEWLGEALHGYLKNCKDLVIIGDEHHVYASKAQSFRAAITELEPRAVIGLTATADTSQKPMIIFEYSLAQALCDRLVKIPVLVGRTDNRDDLDTKLSDGILLLKAKQKAADVYFESGCGKKINAVMLVIAESIDQANQIGELLSRPNLLGQSAKRQVLVIHSQSNDDALNELSLVEEPDSEVRIIISVSMLKEGWDVKNIFVILSLRPSISETLTEQTLGRGLRLPYGKYTDNELLDTVDVVSHDKYEKLLSQAGVLIKGLSEIRVAQAETSTPSLDNESLEVGIFPSLRSPTTTSQSLDDSSEEEKYFQGPGVILTSMENRIQKVTTISDNSIPVPSLNRTVISLPKVIKTVSAPNFSLSSIDDKVFIEIGKKFTSNQGIKLDRKVLDVVEDGAGGFMLSPRQGQTIDAAQESLPLGEIKSYLVQTILNIDFISGDEQSINAAKRLVDAAIKSAGGEEYLYTYHEAAGSMVQKTLRNIFRTGPEVTNQVFEVFTYNPSRITNRKKEPNRFGTFSKDSAYGPWQRSSHEWNWFDSAPELNMANLLDSDIQNDGVKVWSRILRNEGFSIQWSGGTYTPDFYAEINDEFYLIEVKADRDMETTDVEKKKEAAANLARALTDDSRYGKWHYSLISESDLKAFRNVGDLLK